MQNTGSTTRRQNVVSVDKRNPITKRNPYTKLSLKKRKKIIGNVLEAGVTPAQEAAAEYHVAESAVNSMVDVFLKTGRYETKKRGGTKITEEVSNFMRDCLDEYSVTTLKDVQQKVIDQFEIDLSMSSIHKHLVTQQKNSTMSKIKGFGLQINFITSAKKK